MKNKSKLPKVGPKYGYICGTAWHNEIEERGTFVFNYNRSLKKFINCSDECGIVKVKVSLDKWIKKPKEIKNGR